jgi:hypothetical protein
MTALASGAGMPLATPDATFAAVRTDALHLRRVEPGCRHAGRAAFSAFDPGEKNMHIVTNVGPLAALIAGILILVVPRLLNYIVALYLIIIGLLGLFGDHIR